MAKTVIIGGVAGGATTATRLRRRDQKREIVMIERGPYISYANCGLPYYIGDVIKDRDELLVQTVEDMKQRFKIDVRIQEEVIRIDPSQKEITILDHKTNNKYQESYDDLVIATGASPFMPSIKGIESNKVFRFHTVEDMDKVKQYIIQNKPKTAVLVGGGFIGLEMVENLTHQGINVTLIERDAQVFAPVDGDIAQIIHKSLKKNNITLRLKSAVEEFYNEDDRLFVKLDNGDLIETDLVILSIGVKPNSDLVRGSGINVNKRGYISVNPYMQTSIENIYAVGDVIETYDGVFLEPISIPLAGPANKQARLCADNIVGDKKKYKGVLGTSIIKLFNLTAATVGFNEKQLALKGLKKEQDYFSVLISQRSHAGYYPNSFLINLKMIFTKEGKILGAQIVGKDGVDKRIDTIATTMKLNGTVHDLTDLELAYAPPYSSAKDPVNMLGYVAENILDGTVSFIDYKDLNKYENYILLDVREDQERNHFKLDPSYHIPLGKLRERSQELDKSKLIIVYCAIGVRAYNASILLKEQGFENVKVLSGGSFYLQQI